ncbi:U6 small nuclear RNA (adenine-(43)-N(6))-methyltransferase, partial [Aphidius gifuensis]
MSLRKFMHPKNKYKIEPNFRDLAQIYPEFHQHVYTDLTGKLKFNFKSQESLKVLAKILLKHDFNIDVDIPDDKLIPVLPLRLNYIHWIEDLLEHANVKNNIVGIDIGTGAICIYPILCSKLFGWKMIGTEIDETSVSSAINNVKKNNLDNLITVEHADHNIILNKSLIDNNNNNSYLFTMCNPPFFNNNQLMFKKNKKKPPRNASTGNNNELFIDGGECKFVLNIINESIILSTNIKIYTTMLGQKSSLIYFRKEFKNKNIDNYTWTEFCQGYTKRWGLAWTFLSKDVLNLQTAPVIREKNDRKSLNKKSKDKFSVEFTFPLDDKWTDFELIIKSLKQWIQELKIEMKELKLKNDSSNSWVCNLKTYEDTWSHARRKRRLASRETIESKKPRLDDEQVNLINGNSLNQQINYTETKNIYLEFSITVVLINTDNIRINLILHNGNGGKIGLETFRQYLINKFNIKNFLKQKNTIKNCKNK